MTKGGNFETVILHWFKIWNLVKKLKGGGEKARRDMVQH